MPRTHGSALFTRGQTQAMTLLTLGATGEHQRIDGLGLEDSKRYMHHYNFPPFSVGETGFMRGPKRRDIGHGALAERALLPMVPDEKDFPYTIRLVSEILESNGSSSMASVCGSTLSLMDAGVPIKAAGGRHRHGPDQGGRRLRHPHRHRRRRGPPRRHGLQGRRHQERHHRPADGHQDQRRDLRDPREALEQARGGRLFILDKMLAVLPEPRAELSPYAPRIITMQINPDQIGLVIGKGGETIRGMTEEFGVQHRHRGRRHDLHLRPRHGDRRRRSSTASRR